MKASEVLLLGAAAYGVIYVTNLGVATGTVNFVLNGVKINSLNDIVITLAVQNVSNANLEVNSMTGDIQLNGVQFANISDFTKRTVLANNQTNIDIHIKPDFLYLGSSIQALLSMPHPVLNFYISGYVNANSLVLPFNLTKQFTM
jgi:LEA14-like dessication related protein